ncbi:hypothetical protein KA005_58375 [bacterium]|nr:hypothetical protein [bacterium]
MDKDGKMKLDYEQTVSSFHSLAEIRFKLLAMVPTFTIVAVGVIDKADLSSPTVLALGVFGFLATLGIVFYDQRNTQLYDSAQFRAKGLEALMEFEKLKKYNNLKEGKFFQGKLLKIVDKQETDEKHYGGIFLDRPGRSLFLFGLINMWHDRGLSIVYSATLGAWSFVVARGISELCHIKGPIYKLAISLVVFILFLLEFHRHDNPTDPIEKQYPRIKHKLLTGEDLPYDMTEIRKNAQ